MLHILNILISHLNKVTVDSEKALWIVVKMIRGVEWVSYEKKWVDREVFSLEKGMTYRKSNRQVCRKGDQGKVIHWMTLTSKTQKGMWVPILNYIVECSEENINAFKKSLKSRKLIEGKSIMEMQSSPPKEPLNLTPSFHSLLSFTTFPLLSLIRARTLAFFPPLY